MAYTLRTGEMIAILNELDMHDEAHMYIRRLEIIGQNMAELIAQKLGIEAGLCTYDMAMVAAPFYAKDEKQPMPDVFEQMEFDDPDEWGEKG